MVARTSVAAAADAAAGMAWLDALSALQPQTASQSAVEVKESAQSAASEARNAGAQAVEEMKDKAPTSGDGGIR